MPDAITLLKQDHRTVERLFDRFQRTGDAEVAKTICQELRTHTSLEEEIVYPVLRKEVDRTLAAEAIKEHQEAKQLIRKIESTKTAGAQLRQLVMKLEAAIEHHVQEEETEVFPKMKRQLGTDLTRMGEEIARRKTPKVRSAGNGELLDLTKEELYERARKAGIEGRSTMNKRELAKALQGAR
jgi:iron-sulfur cluster repair protein YtfE (RIC family)